jgi:hypothetical protein
VTTPWGFGSLPPVGSPGDGWGLDLDDALDRISRVRMRSLVANDIPLDGVTNAGALVNQLGQDLHNAGGGILQADGIGTVLGETEVDIPPTVTLWTWAPQFLVWKAKNGAGLGCVLRFTTDGHERKASHRVGRVLPNTAGGGATDGVYALAPLQDFYDLNGGGHTNGRFFVPANYEIGLHGMRATSGKYAIEIPTAAEFGTGTRANGFRCDGTGGGVSSSEANIHVAADATQVSGIGFGNMSFEGSKYDVDVPNGANLYGLDLDSSRSEGITGAASRIVRCLDTNSGAIHVTGGEYSAASGGTKPDYLFELEGYAHVLEGFAASNQVVSVVKGLAGLRRSKIGPIEYAGSLFDDALVANKNRNRVDRTNNSNQAALALGDGSAALPTYTAASDKTSGWYFDPAWDGGNGRWCCAIKGVLKAYIDSTGIH